jgi:hypothetical protein
MPDAAYACHSDALSLSQTLQTASGHAEDAEAVIARQARYGGGGSGGSGEPLPVDLTASARYAAIGGAITTWTRHVLDGRGVTLPAWRPVAGPPCRPRSPEHHVYWQMHRCPHQSCEAIRSQSTPGPIAQAAAWLATQVDWLRRQPEADEAFRELTAACEDLARLVDRPADKDLVGMCDCGKVLYAPRGKTVVACPVPTCRLTWNVEKSREILRKALDGKLVTAAEAARLGAYLDTDRNQQQIRKLINAWSVRTMVAAHGEIDGEPTFRFGDIADRLARTPRRTPRADAA